MLKGIADRDFGEWTHKVRTFMLGRFGDHILGALTWASRQRKIVVKGCGLSQRNRFIPWTDVFGEGADEEDQIDDFVGKLHAYLVSFTNDAANGLEAWRRLHGEYDPTSSMRRVAILQQVQNPSRCQRELRIWDLLWKTGSRRNVSTRCSPTGTDGPARHQTTALWRPWSG